MIDLCFLGTGGAIPLPDRGLASLYVRVGSKALLLDCGEGTQVAIRRIGWGFKCLDGLFLTHFHGDHCTGLPGLLLSMAKAKRTEPFHIWGGPGLERVVKGLCVVVPPLPFPVLLHEHSETVYSFQAIGLDCTAFRLDHSVPTWGLRLEKPRAGRFQAQQAEALGLPRPLWRRLQLGEAVEWNGQSVQPDAVMGPPRRGIRFVYATDTRPVPSIAAFGAGADLMILEGMYPDSEKLPLAVKNKHMLFTEAAELARQARPERLILTHFSNSVEAPRAALAPAQAVFPRTEAAEELQVLTLAYPVETE